MLFICQFLFCSFDSQAHSEFSAQTHIYSSIVNELVDIHSRLNALFSSLSLTQFNVQCGSFFLSFP